MGKMKELYTTGQDLPRQMASGQMFVPSFEELRDIQERYLELLRLVNGPKAIPPREDQSEIFPHQV